MKHWIIFFFALSVSLCSGVPPLQTRTDDRQTQNDIRCQEVQRTGPICFDERTLGACMDLGTGSWFGYVTATCDPGFNLCCNSEINGCVIANTCEEEIVVPNTCEYGELLSNPNHCNAYYYCSNGVFVSATCPIGRYDDELKSCVLGTCVD